MADFVSKFSFFFRKPKLEATFFEGGSSEISVIEQGTSAVVLLVKSGFGNFGILGRYKFPLNPSFIGFGMVSINAFSFSGCSNLITCTVVEL